MRSSDIQNSAIYQVHRAFGIAKLAEDSVTANPLSRALQGALSAAIPGAIAGGGLAYLTASPEEQAMKSRVAKGALIGGASSAALNAARHGVGQHLRNIDASKMYDAEAAPWRQTQEAVANRFRKYVPNDENILARLMGPTNKVVEENLSDARGRVRARFPVEPTLLERAYTAARERVARR